MLIQLFLGIIAVELILLLIFSIPFLLQTRKTAASTEDFLKATQASLNPLLSELKQSLERLNRVTEGVEESIKNIRHLAKSMGDIGVLIDELNNFVRQTGLSFSIKTASIGVGVKTALTTFVKGLTKKEGGNTNEQ